MRRVLLGSVAALAAGVALVVLSILEGGATLALFVIFPVVTGSSVAFLIGVALLFVGFLSLPFGLAERWDETSPPPAPPGNPPAPSREEAPEKSAVGGFVLVGPVPIVFGSWKGVSARTRWMLALAGAVLFTFVLVAVLVLVR